MKKNSFIRPILSNKVKGQKLKVLQKSLQNNSRLRIEK